MLNSTKRLVSLAILALLAAGCCTPCADAPSRTHTVTHLSLVLVPAEAQQAELEGLPQSARDAVIDAAWRQVAADTAADMIAMLGSHEIPALPGGLPDELAVAALMRDFLRAGRFAEELPKGCEYDAHGEAGAWFDAGARLDTGKPFFVVRTMKCHVLIGPGLRVPVPNSTPIAFRLYAEGHTFHVKPGVSL